MAIFSQKFNNFFQSVASIILVLGLTHSIYHRIRYSEEYNQPLPDYNTIAKNIDTLMSPIIAGLPPPNAQERRIRPQGYTYTRHDYDNPSQKLIDKVEQNILAQNSWREISPTTETSAIDIIKTYCNGQIELKIYTYLMSKYILEDHLYRQLAIYMYWEQNSDCMDKK